MKIILFALVCLLHLISLKAATLTEIALPERIASAELIVAGRIDSVWTEVRNEGVLTAYTIRVYQPIKGHWNNDAIRVEIPVGVYGERATLCDAFYIPQMHAAGIFMLIKNPYQMPPGNRAQPSSYALYGEHQGLLQHNAHTMQWTDLWRSYTTAELNMLFNSKIDAERFNAHSGVSKLLIITAYSPQNIRAGWGDQLTINGFGFGNSASNGSIWFSNADNGGSDLIRCPSALVVKWSDTQLIVKVPSRAGTGKFKIEAPNGSALSNTNLLINEARINTGTSGSVFPVRLVGRDNNLGYRLFPTEDFSADSLAYRVFIDQLKTWRCLTGINWIPQKGGTKTQSNRDSVLMIGYDDANQLPAGVLGLCFQYYSSCSEGTWYLTEFDILFKRLSSWWYDQIPVPSGRFDFASVCLHELGHAHQLGHVNNPSDLMNFSLTAGTSRRTPSEVSINGCVAICNEASSRETCGINAMRLIPQQACLDEQYSWLNPQAFPNPASDELALRIYPAETGTFLIQFYDLHGKMMLQLEQPSSEIETINIRLNLRSYGFRNGVYVLKILGSGIDHTQKLIVI